MRLVHPRIERKIEWTDTAHIWELIVENPNFMRSLIHDLSDSNDDGLNILNNGKTLKIDQEIEVIFNPFKLNFNNRRALTALLKMLVKSSQSPEFFMTTGELKTNIVKYLYDIVDAEDFTFEVATEDFLVDALAKAVNLRIVDDRNNFVQLITEYLDMMRELVGIKLFVFINLRALISEAELHSFVDNLANHQLDVLLLECTSREAPNNVDRLTIDNDLCEI